ncbi:MAG: metallophosphoesterase [Bacteroidetes bacterium]|nr:metallophosphoesterase [Bacteroidota bacterium]
MKKVHIFLFLFLSVNLTFSQNFTEILGRPTNTSITMNILFDQQVDVFWEYGTTSGVYSNSTTTLVANANVPLETDFINLQTDTKYYYRTRYRTNGSSSAFLAGTEHSFHTPRPAGSAFSFAIEADPHLDTNSNPAAYTLTLQNIFSKTPDFMLDLGDIFMSEKLPVPMQIQSEITNRHTLFRPYFNEVCHSVPLYLVIGNHEGELGWLLNGTANSMPVMASNTRKLYYPNPYPNSFYTGDTTNQPFIGLRENYYAYEWGNVLIVALDPFWYTLVKGDWGWTLGTTQYSWFKSVLETSQAKFKFVFCHNLLGGKGSDARGGAEYVDFFEMGGKNADSTWGFTAYRPNFQKTIHQLMVDNHVQIFFHGHDHLYDKQDKDGMVYQEVPQPSNRNITNTQAVNYGYLSGVIIPGRGYLLVSVTDSSAKVDYFKTFLPNEVTTGHSNGELAYSYTITAPATNIAEINEASAKFSIEQNYPNPFKSETTIKYKVSTANNIQLSVYDMFGREIKTLVNQYQAVGNYAISLNASELSLKTGIYYYKITLGNYSKSMKMICIE